MRILFIDIDTLRPDHMGCYGYFRNTTPVMDGIAKDGVVFNKYYASDAPCLPSRAALATGMLGIHSGVVGHGGTAADKRLQGCERKFTCEWDDNNLFHVFRKAGLYTASISTFPERHSAWWFNSGFNETHNIGRGGDESGEEVLPVVLNWLNQNAEKDNWFLHCHFWDPHTPYRVPQSFGNPFKNDPIPNWVDETLFEEHKQKVGAHCILELYHNNKYPRQPQRVTEYSDLKKIYDGYDTGIRYTDMLIGQIIDCLRKKGLYEDMAIIITSDHGENLGELGIYCDHATADESTAHIPMIIKWPNGAKSHQDDNFHYNLDLAPTIAELLHIVPYSKWDGKSYAAAVLGEESQGHDALVISQLAHVCQRAARFGDWIYIRTIHDGLHLLDDEMLYNVKDDPHEKNNLLLQRPEIAAKGAKIILDWQEKMMKTSSGCIDPMWTVYQEGGPYHCRGKLISYVEELRGTPREKQGEILLHKHQNLISPQLSKADYRS